MKADLLIIEECNKLKEIDIGSNCFSNDEYTNKTNKTLFQVKNCKELIELNIGNNSFNSILQSIKFLMIVLMIILFSLIMMFAAGGGGV